jgi:SOS-response transcriptional repressor LexA
MTSESNRRPLSPRQHTVLRALVLWVRKCRCQPSMRELATSVGMKNVQRVIDQLEAKGWIHRDGERARSIRIPDDVFDSITGATAPETTGD